MKHGTKKEQKGIGDQIAENESQEDLSDILKVEQYTYLIYTLLL